MWIIKIGFMILWLAFIILTAIAFSSYYEAMNKDRYRIITHETNHQLIKELPKLKFKSFLDFYSINPNSWYLGNGWVSKFSQDILKNNYCWSENPKPLIKFGCPSFKFGFIDYIRYSYWKKNKDKTSRTFNKKKKDSEAIENLLIMVQEDIDREKEKAQTMVNESVDTMNSVLTRKSESTKRIEVGVRYV